MIEDIVKSGQVVGKSTLALFGVKLAECLNLPDADKYTSHSWRRCSNFLGCRRRTMRIASRNQEYRAINLIMPYTVTFVVHQITCNVRLLSLDQAPKKRIFMKKKIIKAARPYIM